ncbi:MAG: hypothetical protein J0I06_08215 [Planctomycetes bacterium]|nr:hypothetical protein [Planctomycetota bacterium]
MFAFATVALLSAPAAPVEAGPRYYFILFGGQSIPFQPRTAHTWATFVKATPAADGTTILEPVTISWLPAELPVRPLKLRPVEGRNRSLEETFAIAARNNARVSMWGPFETDAGRYELAVRQVDALNSGAVRFRSLDSLGRNRSVQHCAHAVTFADPNLQRLRQPVIRVGEPGTSRLADKYVESGAFVGTETHDWLLPALGLDRVAVVRREPGERVPRQWR